MPPAVHLARPRPRPAVTELRRVGLDADLITPQLSIGGRPPPGRAVYDHGFQALVCCAEEYQPHPDAHEGVLVVLCPLDDSGAPFTEGERSRARATALGLWSLLETAPSARVLVTCQMGRNRSGLVAALTLRYLARISGEEAMRRVQAARYGSLVNPAFASHLRSLAGPR